MTPIYKSSSCHQQQRAPEREAGGGQGGRGAWDFHSRLQSLRSETNPDLITDRTPPPPVSSDLSHGHTDHY